MSHQKSRHFSTDIFENRFSNFQQTIHLQFFQQPTLSRNYLLKRNKMSNSETKIYEQISDLTPEEFQKLRDDFTRALETSSLAKLIEENYISTLQVINIFFKRKYEETYLFLNSPGMIEKIILDQNSNLEIYFLKENSETSLERIKKRKDSLYMDYVYNAINYLIESGRSPTSEDCARLFHVSNSTMSEILTNIKNSLDNNSELDYVKSFRYVNHSQFLFKEFDFIQGKRMSKSTNRTGVKIYENLKISEEKFLESYERKSGKFEKFIKRISDDLLIYTYKSSEEEKNVSTLPENVLVKDMVNNFLNTDFQIFEDTEKSYPYILEDPFPDSNSPFNLTPRTDKSDSSTKPKSILKSNSPRKSPSIPKLDLSPVTQIQPLKRQFSSSSNDPEYQNENSVKKTRQGAIIPRDLQLTSDSSISTTTFKIFDFFEKEIKELMTNTDLYTYNYENLRICEKVEEMVVRKQQQVANVCYEGNSKNEYNYKFRGQHDDGNVYDILKNMGSEIITNDKNSYNFLFPKMRLIVYFTLRL